MKPKSLSRHIFVALLSGATVYCTLSSGEAKALTYNVLLNLDFQTCASGSDPDCTPPSNPPAGTAQGTLNVQFFYNGTTFSNIIGSWNATSNGIIGSYGANGTATGDFNITAIDFPVSVPPINLSQGMYFGNSAVPTAGMPNPPFTPSIAYVRIETSGLNLLGGGTPGVNPIDISGNFINPQGEAFLCYGASNDGSNNNNCGNSTGSVQYSGEVNLPDVPVPSPFSLFSLFPLAFLRAAQKRYLNPTI